MPRRDIPKLRLRVGLRNEDPIELATATLGEEPTPLAAPTHLPHTTGGMGERGGAALLRHLRAIRLRRGRGEESVPQSERAA